VILENRNMERLHSFGPQDHHNWWLPTPVYCHCCIGAWLIWHCQEASLHEISASYTFFLERLTRRLWQNSWRGLRHQVLNAAPVPLRHQLMSLCIPLASERYATCISAYGPTLTSAEDVKDAFYHSLHLFYPLNWERSFCLAISMRGLETTMLCGVTSLGNMELDTVMTMVSGSSTFAQSMTSSSPTLFQLPDIFKMLWMKPWSKHW